MAIPYWYQKAIFYEVSVQAFYDGNGDGTGDLAGLTQKLDYFNQLGVNCIWLLPIYESPMKDGGYDIADFTHIKSIYGSMDDFAELIQQAHRRQIRVIMDLVLNHTSDEHPWFKAARADRNSPYHDYYVWSESDQKYQDARIIFVDTEKSNWTWNEDTREYYWHRFYTSQPDLNYDNPAVRAEILKVMQFWLDLGIDGFRVDAVPYLIEREGTNCENLPETHQILKELRQFVDQHYPDKVLICEANQWPRDVLKYLGNGDEFQLAFNFPLMPRIYMALRQANSAPIHWALDQLPDIPANCQWGTFLRNHDELTLEMVTEEERQYMWNEYAPDLRYRLNLGFRRRLAPLLDNDRRKIELVHSLLFTMPGSPFLYYGDEIGMGDNVDLFDRNGVRTPMQWDDSVNAGFSSARELYSPVIASPEYASERVNVRAQMKAENSLWQTIRKMITLRIANDVLASHNIQWVACNTPAIAAYLRKSDHEILLAVHNLSDTSTTVDIPLDALKGNQFTDLFTNQIYSGYQKSLKFDVKPYQYLWLRANQ
ncbi:MAG: maltose alpha-D-glucosyltransferase [Anaerolineaceae bacterium]